MNDVIDAFIDEYPEWARYSNSITATSRGNKKHPKCFLYYNVTDRDPLYIGMVEVDIKGTSIHYTCTMRRNAPVSGG